MNLMATGPSSESRFTCFTTSRRCRVPSVYRDLSFPEGSEVWGESRLSEVDLEPSLFKNGFQLCLSSYPFISGLLPGCFLQPPFCLELIACKLPCTVQYIHCLPTPQVSCAWGLSVFFMAQRCLQTVILPFGLRPGKTCSSFWSLGCFTLRTRLLSPFLQPFPF